MSRSQLMKIMASRLAMLIVFFPLFFFLPAETWNYWEAWVCMPVLITPMLFTLNYLIMVNISHSVENRAFLEDGKRNFQP